MKLFVLFRNVSVLNEQLPAKCLRLFCFVTFSQIKYYRLQPLTIVICKNIARIDQIFNKHSHIYTLFNFKIFNKTKLIDCV